MRNSLLTTAMLCMLLGGIAAAEETAEPGDRPGGSTVLPDGKPFANPTGTASSHSTLGNVDLRQSFFQKLGTNDRTCQTCHLPGDAWSVSAATAQKLFNDSRGFAALFQFDGQNVVGADLSTLQKRRAASSLMITKGLVRFNLTLPANAEFQISASEGTYGNPVDATNLVVYRRPLPSTNFGRLTTILWDGRGNFIPGAPTAQAAVEAIFTGGTILHAQGMAPLPEKAAEAGALMFSLTSAQITDNVVGKLDMGGALGGPFNHSSDTTSAILNGPPGFTIFNAWTNSPASNRKQVARGQALFNTRVFPTGGTCAGCHSVSNQGNNANNVLFNIGISDGTRRTPDLPLYTLRNNVTGETIQSSDPGMGITTGKWADINRFKAPGLRSLAARAPYFHNGFAKDLGALVNFYNGRFNIGLTEAEKADMVAFLRSL
jgi:cytochrome c peroxidase